MSVRLSNQEKRELENRKEGQDRVLLSMFDWGREHDSLSSISMWRGLRTAFPQADSEKISYVVEKLIRE